MAQSNVEEFGRLMASDESLQDKLRAAIDAYAGDRQDDKAAFEAVVGPIAEEAGLPFTYEEARDYATQDREVSLDEADDVAGGDNFQTSYCFVIGGTDEGHIEEDCMYGYPDEGTAVCTYVGIAVYF